MGRGINKIMKHRIRKNNLIRILGSKGVDNKLKLILVIMYQRMYWVMVEENNISI